MISVQENDTTFSLYLRGERARNITTDTPTTYILHEGRIQPSVGDGTPLAAIGFVRRLADHLGLTSGQICSIEPSAYATYDARVTVWPQSLHMLTKAQEVAGRYDTGPA